VAPVTSAVEPSSVFVIGPAPSRETADVASNSAVSRLFNPPCE
jgi:hypothetical protein